MNVKIMITLFSFFAALIILMVIMVFIYDVVNSAKQLSKPTEKTYTVIFTAIQPNPKNLQWCGARIIKESEIEYLPYNCLIIDTDNGDVKYKSDFKFPTRNNHILKIDSLNKKGDTLKN